MSFKTASAALAAFFVVASATSATAGLNFPALTASASQTSKTTSESVDLTLMANNSTCRSLDVQFFDKTSSPEKLLCDATMSEASPYSATCNTNLINEPGARTVEARFPTGICASLKAATTINVQEPIPTTSEWTMWGLMGALLLGGGAILSRRFKTVA